MWHHSDPWTMIFTNDSVPWNKIFTYAVILSVENRESGWLQPTKPEMASDFAFYTRGAQIIEVLCFQHSLVMGIK